MKFTCTFLIAAAVFLLPACIKKNVDPTPEPEVPAPTYTVPTTYDFGGNASFSSSAQRINMMKELIGYIRTTHTAASNVTVSPAKMKNMYANASSSFTDATLNSSGINLKDKTNNDLGFMTKADALFDEVATVSQSTVAGSNGQAGKVLGPVPTGTAAQSAWLMDAKGFEYKELVEKGLMGALLYAQATTILKNIGSYDNNAVVSGQGTAMEHAWDEAFGYFGVPVTFPTTTTGLSYWGSYCNSNNAATGFNATIMNAWLKGRAAISNKDDANRDAARDIVVATWEKVGAARLITYLKQAKTNFAIDGQRNHALSEGYGFILGFKYNPSRKIGDLDMALLINNLGDNLYTVTQANIDACITKVATIFSLDPSKL